METKVLLLYYVCSLAGFVMVAGGLYLLYKQKIYIDKESNQITEVQTPIGRFRTNVPALVLFVLGFVPLIYSPWVLREMLSRRVSLVGAVTSAMPVTVYAVVGTEPLLSGRRFGLTIPRQDLPPERPEYKVLYVIDTPLGPMVREDVGKEQRGLVQLQPLEVEPPIARSAPGTSAE